MIEPHLCFRRVKIFQRQRRWRFAPWQGSGQYRGRPIAGQSNGVSYGTWERLRRRGHESAHEHILRGWKVNHLVGINLQLQFFLDLLNSSELDYHCHSAQLMTARRFAWKKVERLRCDCSQSCGCDVHAVIRVKCFGRYGECIISAHTVV